MIRQILKLRLFWVGRVDRKANTRNAKRILIVKHALGMTRHRRIYNIKKDHSETDYENVEWTELAQDHVQGRSLGSAVLQSRRWALINTD
jgi:hypothetical protein